MVDYKLGTVMSSRIRLARNLNGLPFPARLKSDRQAKEIIRSVSAAVNRVDEFRLYYMDGISEDEALNLVENRLISPALLSAPSRSAVLINEAGDISIMINEEDHLREQCISGGLSLRSAYGRMSEKDSLIARSIPFAYDERLGYLTACPTNLGTGLRASVMLFLPALELGGVMPDVIKSVTRLGLTVRGAYGEGTKAKGYIYQVSNEVTLGVTEETILTQVENVVGKIVEMEAGERERLKGCSSSVVIKDRCLRAYGTLTNCALLTHGELDELCADLKLGVCLGYLGCDDVAAIDELTLKMKPSNLNVQSGRVLDERERDVYCAGQVSQKIKKLIRN
ncbi:MAG: ATP--guanido phosphotransferase [Clostridiales bacterium]|nr:ATP--guanido phosphotransferase [Clostridiales bacterium]